jgi:thiamine biosynthesis protein ThiI
MLRRGMKVDCLYFDAPPYTSPEARQKVVDLARVLGQYGLGTTLTVVPFTDVELRLRERAPEPCLTVLLRVCMVKGANAVARSNKDRCLITGESLGQVASQTLENMNVTGHFAELPLLRPLVGMDKEEIVATARQIKTYDTSILPYEDCCVLFSPKHPVIRSRLAEVEHLMAKADIEGTIAEAIAKQSVEVLP